MKLAFFFFFFFLVLELIICRSFYCYFVQYKPIVIKIKMDNDFKVFSIFFLKHMETQLKKKKKIL